MKSFGKNSEPNKQETPVKENANGNEEPINKLLELSGVEPHLGAKPKSSDAVVVQTTPTSQSEKPKEEVKKKPVRVYKAPNLKRRLPPKNGSDKINAARLPLNEKIKRIISDTPLISLFQIQKELRQTKYGETKINLIKLYNILKTLNLNSKEKRYRYYRSV